MKAKMKQGCNFRTGRAARKQKFLRPLRFEPLMERLPFDADDIISGAIFLGAASPTAPRTANGTISPDIDVDMYRVTVTAGQTVDFDIDTTLNGPGGLGSFLRVFDST